MNNTEITRIIATSPYFQSDWYLAEYRDVQVLGMDPAEHYLKYGAHMGRNPGVHFDTLFYLNKNPDVRQAEMNPLVHYVLHGVHEGRETMPDSGIRHLRAQTMPVRDIEKKLWGGFAGLALPDMQAALNSGSGYDDASKAFAAFVLGRWYALHEDWKRAVDTLRMIRRFDINSYRSKKCKVLLVQCLIHNGEFEKAREIIDFALSNGPDGDFALAQSNLLQIEEGAAATERLAGINTIYRAHGLHEISLEDPDRGFMFDNLHQQIPPKISVDGPTVSILMPVYNAGAFIDVALRSLLAQTWKNIEIIAVDDCSSDNSWDRLQVWATKYPRLKVFRTDQNMGAYPTRNRALELSSGEFITVHDSDDWSHPQMIEMQMRAMDANPNIKVSCSNMARVYPDMTFILRPQRGNLEFVHRSYPSILIARRDLEGLGRWDGVSANADDEFVQRARTAWGVDAVVDIMPTVPLSFFLIHENSLTQQKGTSLNSLTFGIRKEYGRQAAYWRKTRTQGGKLAGLSLERTSLKSPFPIPKGLAPKNWEKNNDYDILLITDMSLLGGTRRCNEGYIEAAADMGLRIGLFHWPRYDMRLTEVADEYLELSYRDNVDILVREDQVNCKTVLIHHPPILKYRIDALPDIITQNVFILVNQSPMQLYSQAPFYYDPKEVDALCQDLFGKTPCWIPIAPRVTKILQDTGGYDNILSEVWSPPYRGTLPDHIPDAPIGLGTNRRFVIGRHARDHWTKWPETAETLGAAYCAEAPNITTRILGGARTVKKILGDVPSNWDVLEFDTVAVTDFVQGLDFFLHFIRSDYIEEFGRNIMEAMAGGRVVILPHSFQDTFGDAAVYCEPDQVRSVVERLWENPANYRAQAQRGFDFVVRNCSAPTVQKRLKALASISD